MDSRIAPLPLRIAHLAERRSSPSPRPRLSPQRERERERERERGGGEETHRKKDAAWLILDRTRDARARRFRASLAICRAAASRYGKGRPRAITVNSLIYDTPRIISRDFVRRGFSPPDSLENEPPFANAATSAVRDRTNVRSCSDRSRNSFIPLVNTGDAASTLAFDVNVPSPRKAKEDHTCVSVSFRQSRRRCVGNRSL